MESGMPGLQGSEVHQITSLVLVHDGKLALILDAPGSWSTIPGYTLMPAALPAGKVARGEEPGMTVSRIAREQLNRRVTIIPSPHLYGPSSRHAVDRLMPDEGDRPTPLLRVERIVPDETSRRLITVIVRAYRVASCEDSQAAPGASGLLWVTPRMLRNVLRGMPLGDALLLPGIAMEWWLARAMPEDAMLYVPAEFGERLLVRIAAKYGRDALG